MEVFGGQASANDTLTQNVGMVNSLVITGLLAGTTNFFTVQEYDGASDVSPLAPEVQYFVPLPVLHVVGGLTVTTNPADIHSVTLSWNPSTDAGVAGYQVFSGQASGNYSLTRNLGLVSSLVVTGLVSGTTNFFTVREYDTTWREGDLSPEIQYFVPLPPVWHAVNNVIVTTNPADIHSVYLSWGASTDAGVKGYQVLSGKASGVYTVTKNVNLVSTLLVTGLVSGTTNFFAVRELGTGTNVGALSQAVRWVAPIWHAVGGLTVTANPADIHSAILKWNASTDVGVTGYQIFSGTKSATYTVGRAIGLTSSLVVTGLVAGTTTYYVVRENNAGTNVGGLSPEVHWLAPQPPNAPPTLNVLSNLTININVSQLSLSLSGITSGSPTEKQTLVIAASSSNPALIPNPSVSYASPNTTGTLTLRPVAAKTGTTTILVVVNDGGKTNNIFYRAFTVTVVNLAQQAAMPKITSQIKGGLVVKSKPVVLGVSVSGQAPFNYQWKFNGTNLVGQTAATLTISSVDVANAGAYMVQVSNSAGATNSAVAMLTVLTNTTPTVVAPVVPQAGQFSFQVPAQARLDHMWWRPPRTSRLGPRW